MKHALLVWSILCLILLQPSFAADLEFKVVTLKSVTDYRELGIFRDELMLGAQAIERILVTDLSNDGFDENDMVQLYPSGQVVRLAPISPRLDSLLRSYRLPSNVEIHESRRFFSDYDSLSRDTRGAEALGYGILGGIGERLLRGYHGENVEGYFRFTPQGAVMQAWNFDSMRVNFPPPPPPDAPRTDTFLVVVHDTVVVSRIDTVRLDPVVMRDTVLIPSDVMKPRGLFYRMGLGMLGGSYSMANRESSRGRVILGAGNEWDFGVWDPWISGRQDVRSRVGLRFLAEMAPWKSDTLTARFLETSVEAMYIPAWDRNVFVFGGVRAYYHDDLFWDRVRAAWDENKYTEQNQQDLSQYEMTVKFGLDKLASYGSGKRFGLWLKLSGWIPGSNNSRYNVLYMNGEIGEHWQFDHGDGTDVEAALTARLSESAQMVVSVGQLTMPTMNWSQTYDEGGPIAADRHGTVGIGDLYQTAAIRFAPYSHEDTRMSIAGSFRNNTLEKTIKHNSGPEFFDYYDSYLQASQLGGSVIVDWNIVHADMGVDYFIPSGGDAQVRPHAGLSLMFK